MADKNYDELAKTIVENVGGKSNISDCFHCMSRLRVTLKDVSLVDLDAIKKLGFIDAVINGPQLQVIAGSDVDEISDAMTKILGSATSRGEVEESEPKTASKPKITVKSVFFSFFGGLSGAVQSCIPAMIGCGVIKGLTLLFGAIGLLNTQSTTYSLLNTVGNSIFYFFPIFVGFNTGKKYGGSPILGGVIGALLVHPDFIKLLADAADAGTKVTLFGLPVANTTYSSTILPAYLSVLVMCYVEKFVVKHSPKMVRVIFEPFFTLLIMVPVTLVIVAPIGTYASMLLSGLLRLIYNTAGVFAPAIIACIIPFLVATGTHLAAGAIAANTLITNGVEYVFFPGAIMHNFNHAALSMGVGFKTKNKDLKTSAFSAAFTAFVGGISEPSLYGIFLKYKSCMPALMIGQFAGCLYVGIMHVGFYHFLGGGPAFLSVMEFMSDDPRNLINIIIADAIGMVVTFVLAMFFYSDEKEGVKAN